MKYIFYSFHNKIPAVDKYLNSNMSTNNEINGKTKFEETHTILDFKGSCETLCSLDSNIINR